MRWHHVRDLVIVGAGGHGRELLDIVEAINAMRPTWRFLGFLDDGAPDRGLLARRLAAHLGTSHLLAELDACYVVGTGDSEVRARIDAFATAEGREAAVLVHPQATVASDNVLSPGVIVAAGAHITTNVYLGRHTHLNVGAVVSHDCRLADFVTLSPRSVCNGNVSLREHVFLGTGAIVTPGRTVGARTWVGAGSVVLNDLPPDQVAVGVRPLLRGPDDGPAVPGEARR